jgi:hypothetical protein
MNYLKYNVVSINNTQKHKFMEWIKDTTVVPHTIMDISEIDNNYIYLDSIHLWTAIFEYTEHKLLELYDIDNNYTDNEFDNNSYYAKFDNYCYEKYDTIVKTLQIPMLNKKCPCDINLIDEILKEYKYDIVLLLILFKKLLECDFYKLDFSIVNTTDLIRTQIFKCHNIIQYYDLTKLTVKDTQDLVDNWKYNINYHIEWKHEKNIYIYVNRYKKIVRKVCVIDALCYKLSKGTNNWSAHGNEIKSLIKSFKNDDWIGIINIDVKHDYQINSFEQLEKIFDNYVFKVFKPAIILETSIIACCNSYAETNKCTKKQYKKIKKLINTKLGHIVLNLGIKCVKFSHIYVKNSRYNKRLMCCC